MRTQYSFLTPTPFYFLIRKEEKSKLAIEISGMETLAESPRPSATKTALKANSFPEFRVNGDCAGKIQCKAKTVL